MQDIKETLRKLKPFIGKKADKLWVRYMTGDRLEKQEWEQVIDLLAEKHRISAIEDSITLPPPVKEESGGDVFIGDTRYLSQPSQKFSLNLPEMTPHMGIFGSTGTGKTTLAKNILRELTKQRIPFIVFDWEKNYRDLIKENKEVKIFTIGTDISPFFFNYLKMPEGISYKEYVKNVVEVFNVQHYAPCDVSIVPVNVSLTAQHPAPSFALDVQHARHVHFVQGAQANYHRAIR